MKLKIRSGVVVTLLISTSLLLSAQEDFKPSLNWSGWTHLWYGSVQSESLDPQYGFYIKYLRFKASGNLAPKVKYAAQFAFDKGVPAILDVHMSYEPFDYLKIRAGQFPVPGAKSGVFSSPIWSTSKMMFNDRTAITQNWASFAGLKSYRSAGAMLYGGFLDQKLNYYAMLAMPKSGPGYYFNVNVKTPTFSKEENGVALFSRLEYTPMDKLEIGVNYHRAKGASFDTVAVNRESYSAYVLTHQEKLFVMAEYIGGTNRTSYYDVVDSETSYSGINLEVAYKLAGMIEPAVRFDTYTPNSGDGDSYGYSAYRNLTLGLNFYPYKNIVLMLNYVLRLEEPVDNSYEEIDNNLVYLQLRYKFKQ